jgi:hypothetical protein
MAEGSVKLDSATMKRLRSYLVIKYEGEMYGKMGVTVSQAVNNYLDTEEKALAAKKKKAEAKK